MAQGIVPKIKQTQVFQTVQIPKANQAEPKLNQSAKRVEQKTIMQYVRDIISLELAESTKQTLIDRVNKFFKLSKDEEMMKVQVFLVNQLVKDKVYKQNSKLQLKPIWDHLVTYYKKQESISALNNIQLSIIVWSFANIEIPAINNDAQLWIAFEKEILKRMMVENLNDQMLAQYVSSFAKANQGSNLFWDSLKELFIKRKNEIDKTGISVCINGFAKSKQIEFDEILSAFEERIISQVKSFTPLELLLILTGMAFQQNLKHTYKLSDEYIKIALSISDSLVRTNEISKLGFNRIVSLAWVYSQLKDQQDKLGPLWAQISHIVEDIAIYNEDLLYDQFKSTIFIAKSLSYLHNSLGMFPSFWKSFFSMIRDRDFIKNKIHTLDWDDWNKLLFACSQINVLDSQFEWPQLMQAFLEKSQSNFQQEFVIKGITSFSLVQIGTGEDFWQPMLDLTKQNIKIETLDIYVEMNLLWCLGRNLQNLNIDEYQEMISNIVTHTTMQLNHLLNSNKYQKLQTFIPNFVWSCKVLNIQDAKLWDVVNSILQKEASSFSIEQLYSIVHPISELKVGQEKTMLILFDRFIEVKEEQGHSEEKLRSIEFSFEHNEFTKDLLSSKYSRPILSIDKNE